MQRATEHYDREAKLMSAQRTVRRRLGRRGDWIQIFLVFFFFLILFIALALLFLEKDTLQTTRPELNQDLLQQQTDMTLLALLRTPVMIDMNGDNVLDQVTFATALSKGMSKEEIIKIINSNLERNVPIYCKIQTPKETIEFKRMNKAEDMILSRAPRAKILLPGNVQVELLYADKNVLYYLLSYKGEKKAKSDAEAIMQSAAEAKP